MVRLSTSPREMEPDVAALKVADLKVALRSRGLSVAGRKAELAARLRAALADKENDEAVDQHLHQLDVLGLGFVRVSVRVS